MSDKTNISWTDATWGPLYGCTKVSQGCKNCYAIDVVGSLPRKFKDTNPKAFEFYSGLVENGNWTGVVKLHEEHLTQPLRWQRPRRIFVNSLSDLFHENVTDEMVERIFAVMALAHWHTFQVLTKRPERMQALLSRSDFWDRVQLGASLQNSNHQHERNPRLGKQHPGISWPPKNVWLGVSVENQAAADERIPLLLRTPAAVRFLSCEPLLGPLDLEPYLYVPTHCKDCGSGKSFYDTNPENLPVIGTCLMGAPVTGEPGAVRCGDCKSLNVDELAPVDQVIVGGESGPNFRAMDPRWAESLRDQCVAAEVAFFFKQHSNRKAGHQPWLRDNEGRCFRWHQFPGDLSEPELLWIP